MPTDPELPRFDALRDFLDAQTAVPEHVTTPVKKWINKLEEWSKDRLAEMKQLEDQVRGYEEVEREIMADTETWESLQYAMHDVRLGLAKAEEFFERWTDVPPWIGERAPGGSM
jgi:hypothetical protein